jgi:hypothetical protein
MTAQRSLLSAYRFLLRLYPAAFRRRFAPEMLEIAAAAELMEWPLILGDTTLAIVRSWIESPENTSTAVPAGPGVYLAIGDSSLSPMRVVQGLVLSIAIVLGLYYVDSQAPGPPPCRILATDLVSTVPVRNSQLTASTPQSRPKIRHAFVDSPRPHP